MLERLRLYLPKFAKKISVKVRNFLGSHVIVPELGAPLQNLTGQGSKGVLVLYACQQTDSMPPQILFNILQSIGLQVGADTWQIPLRNDQKIALARWCTKHQAKTVLVFGCLPQQLGLKTTHQKNIWLTLTGFSLLFTDSLEDLEQNKALKIALWEALKTF